jgi:hypothetical protein
VRVLREGRQRPLPANAIGFGDNNVREGEIMHCYIDYDEDILEMGIFVVIRRVQEWLWITAFGVTFSNSCGVVHDDILGPLLVSSPLHGAWEFGRQPILEQSAVGVYHLSFAQPEETVARRWCQVSPTMQKAAVLLTKLTTLSSQNFLSHSTFLGMV